MSRFGRLRAFPVGILFKWQPTTDDVNGIGLFRYEIYRDGVIAAITTS